MAKPSEKKPLWKRLLKIVGIALAIPVGLVLILVLVLHTGPAQRKLRDIIVARVGQRVNGSFAIGGLDFALGGDIVLSDVRIADDAGVEVIHLASLKVSPAWGSLISSRGATIGVDEVSLDGLRIALTQDKEGVLSIKTLFKPSPPEPPKPEAPKKERHIVVSKLHIGDVNIGIDKADGTRIAIEKLGLDGTIDAVPTTKSATVKLHMSTDFKLIKEQDGLTLAVTGISTGVSIDVQNAEGTLSVLPTKAHARISQEGFQDREIDLDLSGVDVSISPATMGATLTKLALGAVVLQSLEVRAGVADGSLKGEQKVQLLGLHVDGEHVNKLLQKKLLVTDVDIETKISGPPEAILLATRVDTQGGNIAIDGTIDASAPARPRFDLLLAATNIDTQKLMESEKVPPAKIERLALGVRGEGRTREGAEVDLGLHIAGVSVEKDGVTYRIDDVVAEARYDGAQVSLEPLVAQAYGHEVIVRGWVDLTRMLVDVHLTMAGDVGKTLANLKAGGLPIKTDLPRSAVVMGEDTVAVDVRGNLEGLLDADVAIHNLQLAGGSVFADVHAQLFRNVLAGPDDKKVELRDLDGVVELKAINLKQALALRGKKLEGLTGNVSAKVVVDDVPKSPWIDYRIEARLQASDDYRIDVNRPVLVAVAKGRGSKTDATLDLAVTSTSGPARTELIDADAKIPLAISDTYKGIDPHRPLHVALEIPNAPLRELAQYVPRQRLIDQKTGEPREIPRGNIAAKIALDGTAAAPTGTIELDLNARMHPLRKQRVKIDGKIASDERPKVRIESDLGVWLDGDEGQTLKGRVGAELSRSFLLPGPKDVNWWLDLDLLPLKLEEFVEARLVGLSGTASAGIHLKGNASDVSGKIDIDVAKFQKGELGKIDAHVGIGIEADKTPLEVTAAINGTDVLDLRGQIGRPGTGLLAALRDKTPDKSTIDKLGNPPIDLKLTVVKHAPKTWAFRVPALEKLPGSFGGEIAISGTASMPVAKGEIGYTDFENLKGQTGRAVVLLDAGPETINADIEIGPRIGDKAPVGIHVDLQRAAIKPYLDAKKCWRDDKRTAPCTEGVTLPLHATIEAKQADLEDLVPKFVVADKPVKFDGNLDWELIGNVILDPKPRFAADGSELPAVSPQSELTGKLALTDGTLALLGTTRHYQDATIIIRHDLNGIDVEKVALREATKDNPNRTLALKAHVDLNDLKLGRVTADLSTRDFLLFGAERVGPADSPYGDLDSDIHVDGDLSGKIKKLDVRVDKLELLVPERFNKAHQAAVVHLGDIIYLKDGMKPGKLPVPKKPDPVEPGDQTTGLDVVITIPKPGRLLLQNMDLSPKGKITLEKRGNVRKLEGKLDMVDGQLELGGRQHKLVRGAMIFNAECPAGCMDLDFARSEPPATMREVSQESRGDAVKISLRGPIDNRTTVLDGAGSPGTLYDLLAMHNAGRPRYHGEPDNPSTTVTNYPQFDNLLLMSYLAVNVPNLLFMDKVSAWSDVYDGRSTESYGQVRHFNAESYTDDGNFRVRAEARPRAAGQSENEVGFDWLWANDNQTAVGVGISGGDRLGGGPGVFLEWSSKD